MKYKYVFFLSLLLILISGMLSGCSSESHEEDHDHGAGERCTSNSDCHEDEVCHGGFCEESEEHEDHSP